MKYLKAIIKSFILLVAFSMMNIQGASAQYVAGDYGSTASGNWTAVATWSTWNGAAWVAAGSTPSSLTNVFILAGKTVNLDASPMGCKDLTVEAGGKLMAGMGGNLYISVYGSNFVCDGQIGNGAIFDQISFNIEAANCTITGTGQFDASRMRKSASTNPTTNLIIARDINLQWNAASSSAQLYNNCSFTRFNVTINAGATVTLIQNGPNPGNITIDGNTGADAIEGGGIYTINGTLKVSGVLYFTTNNVDTTYRSKWIINGLVQTNEISAPVSTAARDSMIINNGGKLELTGTPSFSTLFASAPTNYNFFIFNNGSTVEYSAAGNQTVKVAADFASVGGANNLRYYYNLILSNSGLKTTSATNLIARNDITITGSAILNPSPINCQISLGGNWSDYNNTGFNELNSLVVFNANVTYPPGSVVQTITCGGANGETFYNLRYTNSINHLQLNSKVSIANQLVFFSNGYIDLNSNTLTIQNPLATGISGQTNARYIYSEKTDNSSKIVWQIGASTGTYTFPFGVPPGGAANYIPVVVTKNGASSIGDLSFATYGTALPDNQPWPVTPTTVTNLKAYLPQHNSPDNSSWTVDRFWEVGSTSPTPLDSVRFSYRVTELPDSDLTPTNLAAQFWNSTYWYPWGIPPTPYGVSIPYNVGVPGFFVFNTSWTLTSITSPLPVKLLFFDAKPEEEKVALGWSTASEINNDFFTVEKSLDAENFTSIGKVQGSGNSTTIQKYSFDDLKPVIGISYYRLKQTDFNGESAISRIIPIRYKKEGKQWSVFPNPASDKAYLMTEPDKKQEIFIRNSEGMLILHYLVEKSRLINPLTLTDLKQGIYFIEVASESETQFLKLIKK